MSVYIKIKSELDDNPGLYAAMTNQQVVDELNAPKPPTSRESIAGAELFGYTDAAEYGVLTDPQKQQWLGLCGIDIITAAAVPLIKSLFNVGSTTWSNIVKTEVKTRAQELGFNNLAEEDIRIARAQ